MATSVGKSRVTSSVFWPTGDCTSLWLLAFSCVAGATTDAETVIEGSRRLVWVSTEMVIEGRRSSVWVPTEAFLTSDNNLFRWTNFVSLGTDDKLSSIISLSSTRNRRMVWCLLFGAVCSIIRKCSKKKIAWRI
jgi:hypothetical protein